MAMIDKSTAVSMGLVITVCALVWAVASNHTKTELQSENTSEVISKLEAIAEQQAQLISQNSLQIANLKRQFDASKAAGPRWSTAMEVLLFQLEKDRGEPVHPEEILRYFHEAP